MRCCVECVNSVRLRVSVDYVLYGCCAQSLCVEQCVVHSIYATPR
jgi:hypothetical protein